MHTKIRLYANRMRDALQFASPAGTKSVPTGDTGQSTLSMKIDEPTNDLDVFTLGILEEFLLDFPGCLLLVSHDRYFMDKLVDHVFVLDGKGGVRDFPGNYTQYRIKADAEEKAEKKGKAKEYE